MLRPWKAVASDFRPTFLPSQVLLSSRQPAELRKIPFFLPGAPESCSAHLRQPQRLDDQTPKGAKESCCLERRSNRPCSMDLSSSAERGFGPAYRTPRGESFGTSILAVRTILVHFPRLYRKNRPIFIILENAFGFISLTLLGTPGYCSRGSTQAGLWRPLTDQVHGSVAARGGCLSPVDHDRFLLLL